MFPEIVNDFFSFVFYYLENYGWLMLVVGVCFAILWHRRIGPIVDNYRQYKFEQEYAAKYHKNPDLFSARAAEQQKHVEKLQEEYNRKAEEFKAKQEEREKRKRDLILQEFEDKHGHVLGDGSSKPSKNNDYNPLMGHGGSSTYRPPRRNRCGGGGCG